MLVVYRKSNAWFSKAARRDDELMLFVELLRGLKARGPSERELGWKRVGRRVKTRSKTLELVAAR